MREILFRGRSPRSRQWHEGELFNATGKIPPYLPMILETSETGRCDAFDVDPDTVGQFTGLTDKNGKKIFEGDIVHILGNQNVDDWKSVDYTALIAFLDGGFCAIDGTIEEHAFRRYALARLDFSLEVIGNIHDNPELLGGTDNG